MSPARRALAVVSVAWLVLVPTAALATDIGADDLRDLAARAQTDDRALQRLRRVDSVDGRPVDIERALRGASGEDLDRRLETLARADDAAPGTSASARDLAADILDDRGYAEPELPRPFEGVLETLGDWLEPVIEFLGDVVDFVVPDVGSPAWWVAGVIVLVLTLVVTSLVIQRRSRKSVARAAAMGDGPRPTDPRELERQADEAETRGDIEGAIRLRFLAGLLRLDRAEVIDFHPWLTSGEVARRLRSPAFDEVARSFDHIVYGRRLARSADAQRARRDWERVLQETGAR